MILTMTAANRSLSSMIQVIIYGHCGGHQL
jgi:hypothetical protein